MKGKRNESGVCVASCDTGVTPPPLANRAPPPLCKGRAAAQYLVGALPDRVDELLNHQIDTFETGLFQLYNLLFHDGFERQVRSEQASSENIQGCGETDRRTDRVTKKNVQTDKQVKMTTEAKRRDMQMVRR